MINDIGAFYNLLTQSSIIVNENIELPGENILFRKFPSAWITFENCSFKCSDISFININQPDLIINFKNCSFDCDIKIVNCILNRFEFLNTQALKGLHVEKGLSENTKLEMKYFQFSNTPGIEAPQLDTVFSFKNCFFEKFEFINIKHIGGKFKFIENILGNKSNAVSHLFFEESQFFNALFSRNRFEQLTSFFKASFMYNEVDLQHSGYKNTKFYNNTFYKIEFSEANFNTKCDFDKCDFESTTWLRNCSNIQNSQLSFIACKFEGYVLFDSANLNKLEIVHSTFERKVSFFNLVVNEIKLHQLTFNKVAYFDEMRINNIENNTYLKKASALRIKEWKHTLRIIKQELQRTENKIDFNRFRNYELATHYKELNLFENFKDTFILWATKWSTNFGSWSWALCFTIISGLFWYTLLYFFEFYIALNLSNDNSFIIGLFRFFLVTDFYSPFLERQYLNNGFSWTIFVTGKIFIAFGIYEMIQAFRKFKA